MFHAASAAAPAQGPHSVSAGLGPPIYQRWQPGCRRRCGWSHLLTPSSAEIPGFGWCCRCRAAPAVRVRCISKWPLSRQFSTRVHRGCPAWVSLGCCRCSPPRKSWSATFGKSVATSGARSTGMSACVDGLRKVENISAFWSLRYWPCQTTTVCVCFCK